MPAAQLPVTAGKLTYSDTDVSGNAVIDATAAVAQPTVSQSAGTVTTSAFASTISETHASTKWERGGVMGAADAANLLSKAFFSDVLGTPVAIRAAHIDSNGNQSQRSAPVNVTTAAVSIPMSAGYPTVAASRLFDHSDVALALSNIKTTSFTSVTLGGSSIGAGNGTAAAAFIANTLNIGVANEVSCFFGLFDGSFTKVVKVKFTVVADNIVINATEAGHWNGNVLTDAGWTTSGGVPANRQSTSAPATSQTTPAYGLHALTVNFQA